MDVKNMCHKLIFVLKKEKFHFSHPFLLAFFSTLPVRVISQLGFEHAFKCK